MATSHNYPSTGEPGISTENQREQNDMLSLLKSEAEEFVYLENIAKHLEGKSPSYLLDVKLDELIKRCLEDAHKTGPENENCLMLFNAILPQLPHHKGESNIYRKLFSTLASVSHDKLVHQLVSRNMNVIIRTVADFARRPVTHRENLCTAFLKVLHLACAPLISQLLRDRLFRSMILTFLQPRCKAQNRLGLKALDILIDRGDEKLRNDLLSIETVVEIDRMRLCYKEAEDFYLKRRLYIFLANRSKSRDYMRMACRGFNNDTVDMATMALLKVMEMYEEYSPYDFVALIECLDKFLCRALDQKNESDLRTFMTILLDVSWPSEDELRLRSTSFTRLHGILEEILKKVIERWKRFTPCPDCRNDAREYYEKVIKRSVSLMKFLYILNHTWHQWFDITSSSKLVASGDLVSLTLTRELHNLLLNIRDEQKIATRTPLLMELCKFHPCAFSFQDRLHIFDKWRESLKVLLVRTKKNDSLEHFSNIAAAARTRFYRWLIIHEEGRMEKGFYHNVADEFQKQRFDIWMKYGNVALDRTDTENSLCACPTNGLFPNILESNNQNMFHLLGQYIARLFVDDFKLYIPLSLELLHCFVDKIYTKYDKKYYDLMKIMPEAEQIIKQLLKVKRRKLKITSDASLTKDEKNKMITDLRLGGGVKFEYVRIPFVMPLTGEELKKNGANIMVSPHNVEEYLSCLDRASDNISRCANVRSVRKGFESFCPIDKTSLFSTHELKEFWQFDHLKWTERALLQSFELIDGYTSNSEQIVFLVRLLTNLSTIDKSRFLHFVTGSACLPRDGLAGLTTRLKISRLAVTLKDVVDSTLPKASTLHHMLYLPEYSSEEVLKTNLMKVLEVNEEMLCFSP